MSQLPVEERGERHGVQAVCEAPRSACSRPVAAQNKRSSSKGRKSRVVPKAPAREFSAHNKAQFKRIAQRFTGLPTTPASPPILSPTPPPPPPPPLSMSPPLCPNLSPLPDCPQLLASAISRSLLSSLHLISAACLQLLHGGSSPHPKNVGIPSDESKTKTLAFLQGLQLHSRGGGGGENSSLQGVDDFLASLSNEVGALSPLVLNPNPACGSVALKSSFRDEYVIDDDPKRLFAVPNTTICSDDPKPSLAMETHDLTNDHCSISCCDDALGDCLLSPLCASSPLHTAFHDINYSIHIHNGTLGEELDLIENLDVES